MDATKEKEDSLSNSTNKPIKETTNGPDDGNDIQDVRLSMETLSPESPVQEPEEMPGLTEPPTTGETRIDMPNDENSQELQPEGVEEVDQRVEELIRDIHKLFYETYHQVSLLDKIIGFFKNIVGRK